MAAFAKFSILWGLIVVAAARLGGLFLQASQGNLNALSLGTLLQLGVTFMTGFWYYVRMRYTDRRGAPQGGTISFLMSSIIAVTGLACFIIVGTVWWYVLHAAVLLLGASKDCEIILFQGRQIKRGLTQEPAQRSWSRFLQLHHYYSILRDMSMAFWWGLAGTPVYYVELEPGLAMLLFGVPYFLLALGWVLVKERTWKAEAECFGLDDIHTFLSD